MTNAIMDYTRQSKLQTVFFLNTKYRYDSSIHIYPHRLKRNQRMQRQSPILPFNNQNELEYTYRFPKEPVLQLLVHSSISLTILAHISMFVHTIVTFKQAHFYSDKHAIPANAF